MSLSRRQFIIGAAGAGLVLLAQPVSRYIPAWGTSLALGAGIKYVSNRTSPGGNGTLGNPFQVSEIWRNALPGDEFVFLNGVYKGATSMLDVAYGTGEGVSGTASSWITMRAEVEGQVTFDGQWTYAPIRLAANQFITVQGFNACNSAEGAVVSATAFSSGTNRPCQWIQFKRICAWDAPTTTNHHVFSINGGTNILVEDCAGWGSGRKIFEVFNGGSGTGGGFGGGGATLRRCWGEWNKFGTTAFGPQHTFSISYWYTNVIAENLIGTWNTESGYSPNNPYDIFGHDGTASPRYVKLLGSIAYLRQGQRCEAGMMVFFPGYLGDVEVRDTMACIEPGTAHRGIKPFLAGAPTYSGTNSILDCSSVNNGTLSSIASGWATANFAEGATAVTSATSMKRYENGLKTAQALFPWPMNQRILDARRQSGRTAVDVTATIQEVAGSGSADTNPPARPTILSVI